MYATQQNAHRLLNLESFFKFLLFPLVYLFLCTKHTFSVDRGTDTAYTSLDRSRNLVRLLHLNPASNEEEEMKCQFSVALLDDKPHYEALSYVWGNVNDTRQVEVEGSSSSITANLYTALKHLRLQDRERILWVDALCINQADLSERMHQVSRMSSIYGQASQVVVWLGEGWDGSDVAMEFLRKLGEDETLHLDPFQPPCIQVDGVDLTSAKLCADLIRLFDLPWWKHVWTVQEFVLAQNLLFQCSKRILSQELMYMARENFWSHKDQCRLGFNT
jgi:hypothetical protein